MKTFRSERPDLLILSGDKLRHRYFAAKLLTAFENAALMVESHAAIASENYVQEPDAEIRAHFDEFVATERRYFHDFVTANEELLGNALVRSVPQGAINDPAVVAHVRDVNPNLIVAHSTSIIKEGIINAFPDRIINLHAGLSPWYRGSGTNLWPFYNGELECVGMTVHYLDPGIDSGDIILQGRPNWEASDTTHTSGCKNIIIGTELVIRVVEQFLTGEPAPRHRQDKSLGKLYLKRHFNDEVIRCIRDRIENGLVAEYSRTPKPLDIVEW